MAKTPFTPEPNIITEEVGTGYPNGTILWQQIIPERPTHPLLTETGRAEAQENYKKTLGANGIVPTNKNRLKFYTRNRTVSFSAPERVKEVN